MRYDSSNASLSKKQKPSLTQTPSLQLEIRSLCQVQCFFHQGKAKAFAGNDGHVLRVAANLGRVQTVDARAARKHGFSETGWHKTHDAAYVPQGAFFCLFCFLTLETVEVIAALQLDILVNFDEAEPSHLNFETSRTGLVFFVWKFQPSSEPRRRRSCQTRALREGSCSCDPFARAQVILETS